MRVLQSPGALRVGTADLPAELQDHTANALRVIATKFRQDANNNSANAWAPSVKGAAALWRTAFAVSPTFTKSTPLLAERE